METRVKRAEGRCAELLAALIDASPVAIFAVEREGIVTLWSPAAERVFGWSEEEVLGRPLAIVTKEPDEFGQLRIEVLRGGTFAGETRVQRKDASSLDVSFSTAGVIGSTGEVEEVVVLVEDITERRRAEQAVRESAERLRLKLTATRTGSWDWDLDSNEMQWSENMAPQYGLPLGAVVPTYEAFLDLVYPDDRSLLGTAVTEAVEAGKDFEVEFRAGWPDGTVRWHAVQAHVQLDETGRPVRLLGLSRDITDRKLLEEEVAASYEAALRAHRQAEALAQRLTDIQRVTDVALAHTSVDDLLHALLGHVNAALKADTTTVFLLGEEQRFERRATLGSDDVHDQGSQHRRPEPRPSNRRTPRADRPRGRLGTW